jgi:hypothetical protein
MPRTATLSAVQVAAVVAVALVAGGVGAVVLEDVVAPDDTAPTTTDDMTDAPDISTFDSPEEFRTYLSRAPGGGEVQAAAARSGEAGDAVSDDVEVEDRPAPEPEPRGTPAPAETLVPTVADGGPGNGADSGERRASDTNVQVEGIDEPDILKTTPRTAYYAPPGPRVHEDERSDRPTDEGVRYVRPRGPCVPAARNRRSGAWS